MNNFLFTVNLQILYVFKKYKLNLLFSTEGIIPLLQKEIKCVKNIPLLQRNLTTLCLARHKSKYCQQVSSGCHSSVLCTGGATPEVQSLELGFPV